MNPSTPAQTSESDQAAIEGRVGLRLAAHLERGLSASISHDVGERLRVSRQQAVARASQVRKAVAAQSLQAQGAGAAAVLNAGDSHWAWRWFGSAVPAMALVFGLVALNQMQTDEQMVAAAEVVTSILADDLPPEAFSDPGFNEFLGESRGAGRPLTLMESVQ